MAKDANEEIALARQQLAEAQASLAEAQATLEAIRQGQVDAVMVELGDAHEVYALHSFDLPYRAFIEQMAEGALSLDRAHTILYCNQFFCELVGVEREDMIGQSFMNWLDASSQRAFNRAIASGEVVKVAATLVQVGGETIPVRLAITPPGVHSRRRTNVVVSDLRVSRYLSRVTQARDAAEAASSAKDRFLAVLGHELRNPLAALTNAVAILEGSSLDDERRRWVYASMSRQLTQLRSLVNDLLDVTRVAQGKIVLRKEEVSLAAVVAAAVESIQELVSERNHKLRTVGVPAGIKVVADPTRLEQIVVNLVSNAAKYTEPGGEITVTAEEDDESVSLAVSDTGVGLAPDDVEQIFEPFAQVEVQGGSGLGIGLTLVRQLVDLHGGAVWAESAGLGQGTTFRVKLPRGTTRPKAELAASPADSTAATGLRVLIVDDHEDSAFLLAELLRAQGFVVETLHAGGEVVEVVGRYEPALILLDLGLPDVPGYDVARAVRAAGHDRIVIIAVTGFSHEEARNQVKEAGFDGHLVKPVTVSQIVDLVDTFRDRLP